MAAPFVSKTKLGNILIEPYKNCRQFTDGGTFGKIINKRPRNKFQKFPGTILFLSSNIFPGRLFRKFLFIVARHCSGGFESIGHEKTWQGEDEMDLNMNKG